MKAVNSDFRPNYLFAIQASFFDGPMCSSSVLLILSLHGNYLPERRGEIQLKMPYFLKNTKSRCEVL